MAQMSASHSAPCALLMAPEKGTERALAGGGPEPILRIPPGGLQMFGIRVFTPPLTGDDGWPHAGAELRVGVDRMPFRVDLRYWRIADYERQWKEGIARLTSGAG